MAQAQGQFRVLGGHGGEAKDEDNDGQNGRSAQQDGRPRDGPRVGRRVVGGVAIALASTSAPDPGLICLGRLDRQH